MATQKCNSLFGAMIEKPSVEKDMDMVGTGEASGVAGQWSGKITRMSFKAASKQWVLNKHGKRLRNENSERVSVTRDWRSQMERTVRQQAREVTQLQQNIDRMARMLEAHPARKEAQWRGMIEWLKVRETNWDHRHWDDRPWGAGIEVMTGTVLAKVRVGEAAPTQNGRKNERNKTARQDGAGLGASQHAGAMQGS